MRQPPRSVLFLPASNPRAVEKARTLACDAVVLDLEDAVAPEAKVEAREAALRAVREGGFRAGVVAVRVNALDSPWGEADLASAAGSGANAVVIPKLASAEALRAWDGALCAAPEPLRLWAMIETAAGVMNLWDIAGAAGGRLQALVFGANDLSKELGRPLGRSRLGLHPALAWTVAAARAAGLAPIDGVFNDITDAEGFEAECREGREFGFDGKSLIHPSQVEAANRVFSPEAEDLAWARAVVAAFADPANAGKGVVRVEGRMAERLHLEQAERLLATAGG
jgi:citrate lyase subunit beta/citryl-CoA lyase